MQQRTRLSAFGSALVLLAGCGTPAPGGSTLNVRQVAGTTHAAAPGLLNPLASRLTGALASAGDVTVSFAGLHAAQRAILSVGDVASVVLALTAADGSKQTQTLDTAALAAANPQAVFKAVPVGKATLTVSPFDASHKALGTGSSTVTVLAGQTAVAAITVHLNASATGNVTASVTFVEQQPSPAPSTSPTPTPKPTSKPSSNPSSNPTANPTSTPTETPSGLPTPSTPGGNITVPADPLATLKAGHGNLVMDAGQVARLKQRITTDPVAATWYKTINDRAVACLKDPLVKPGDPYGYVGKSRTALSENTNLAVAYLMTHDARFATKLHDNLLYIAAQPAWQGVDFLATGETCVAMAYGYDTIYDTLTKAERTTIEDAIVAKGLNKGLAAYADKSQWWPGLAINWMCVCHGGLAVAAVAVADSHPDVARQVLSQGLAHFKNYPAAWDGDDGSFNESPMYWDYAMQFYAYYSDGLTHKLGTDFGLSTVPGIARQGEFRMATTGTGGKPFNFGDSEMDTVRMAPSGEMIWMAGKFDRPDYLAHEEQTVPTADIVADHLRYLANAPAKSPISMATNQVFNFGLSTFRSSWTDSQGQYVGIKGGSNSANHGDLDAGDFILEQQGVRWAVDLGSEDYSVPGYFGSKRFTYYRTSTIGQNTLLVDGKNQSLKALSKVVAFDGTNGHAFSVTDLSAAYAGVLTSARRGVMTIGNHATLIQDEFKAASPVDAVWQMHTRATVTLTGKQALLSQGGKQEVFTLLNTDGAYFATSSPAGQPGITKLEVHYAAKQTSARIAVWAAPAGDSTAKPALQSLDAWVAASPYHAN